MKQGLQKVSNFLITYTQWSLSPSNGASPSLDHMISKMELNTAFVAIVCVEEQKKKVDGLLEQTLFCNYLCAY